MHTHSCAGTHGAVAGEKKLGKQVFLWKNSWWLMFEKIHRTLIYSVSLCKCTCKLTLYIVLPLFPMEDGADFFFFYLYPYLNDIQALLRLPKTWLEKLWWKVKALFESWKCQVSAPQAPNALSLSLRLLLGPASDTHARAKSESIRGLPSNLAWVPSFRIIVTGSNTAIHLSGDKSSFSTCFLSLQF